MFYVGLDVSVGRTSVCIMDAVGQVAREQSVASTPEAIATAIRAIGMEIERIGLEAGINSAWIARGLLEFRLPVIVIDATHAAAAPKTGFRNKTDKNDAREQVPHRAVRRLFERQLLGAVRCDHAPARAQARQACGQCGGLALAAGGWRTHACTRLLARCRLSAWRSSARRCKRSPRRIA